MHQNFSLRSLNEREVALGDKHGADDVGGYPSDNIGRRDGEDGFTRVTLERA